MDSVAKLAAFRFSTLNISVSEMFSILLLFPYND